MVTIPTGYGQLTLAMSGANIEGEAVITQGFQNVGADDAGTIADLFKSTFTASEFWERFSTTLAFDEARVKLGPSSTGEAAVVDIGLTGAVGGQPVSPQVALLLRKTTALGGRQGRGRTFLPGLPQAALDDSATWDTVEPSECATNWQGIWAAMLLGGQPPVLLHSGALTPTPVTAFVGASRVATQRRRNRR